MHDSLPNCYHYHSIAAVCSGRSAARIFLKPQAKSFASEKEDGGRMRRSADGSVLEEICRQQGCSVPLPAATCLSLSLASLPLPSEASTVGIPNKGVPGFNLLEASDVCPAF